VVPLREPELLRHVFLLVAQRGVSKLVLTLVLEPPQGRRHVKRPNDVLAAVSCGFHSEASTAEGIERLVRHGGVL